MVNDILDFSRYESQNIRLEKAKQNIMEIVEDCVNQIENSLNTIKEILEKIKNGG